MKRSLWSFSAHVVSSFTLSLFIYVCITHTHTHRFPLGVSSGQRAPFSRSHGDLHISNEIIIVIGGLINPLPTTHLSSMSDFYSFFRLRALDPDREEEKVTYRSLRGEHGIRDKREKKEAKGKRARIERREIDVGERRERKQGVWDSYRWGEEKEKERRSGDFKENTRGSLKNEMKKDVEHEGWLNRESGCLKVMCIREPCAETWTQSPPLLSPLSFICLHHPLPAARFPFCTYSLHLFSALVPLSSLSPLPVCLFFTLAQTLPASTSRSLSLYLSPSASKSCLCGRPPGHLPLEVE